MSFSSSSRDHPCFGDSRNREKGSTAWIQVLFKKNKSSKSEGSADKDPAIKHSRSFISNYKSIRSEDGYLEIKCRGARGSRLEKVERLAKPLKRAHGIRRTQNRKSSKCTHTLISTENSCMIMDKDSQESLDRLSVPYSGTGQGYTNPSLRRVISNPLEYQTSITSRKIPLVSSLSCATL